MATQPSLLSIITPCLNRAATIRQAIESVLNQDYSPVEHIIVDGGSTDGTLGILKQYPHLHVISEPDQGLYDALNKGIRAAHGEIIGQLNSDDLYAPAVFAEVMQWFAAHPTSDAVVGGATVFAEQGTELSILHRYPPICPETFLEQITSGVAIFNAWFFRKILFDRFGGYQTHYKAAADRDFLIRLANERLNFGQIEKTVYQYRQHAGSLTINPTGEGAGIIRGEYLTVAKNHFLSAHSLPAVQIACKAWYRKEALDTAAAYLYQGKLLPALIFIARGWRYDAAFPLAMLKRFWQALKRRISKKQK